MRTKLLFAEAEGEDSDPVKLVYAPPPRSLTLPEIYLLPVLRK